MPGESVVCWPGAGPGEPGGSRALGLRPPGRPGSQPDRVEGESSGPHVRRRFNGGRGCPGTSWAAREVRDRALGGPLLLEQRPQRRRVGDRKLACAAHADVGRGRTTLRRRSLASGDTSAAPSSWWTSTCAGAKRPALRRAALRRSALAGAPAPPHEINTPVQWCPTASTSSAMRRAISSRCRGRLASRG